MCGYIALAETFRAMKGATLAVVNGLSTEIIFAIRDFDVSEKAIKITDENGEIVQISHEKAGDLLRANNNGEIFELHFINGTKLAIMPKGGVNGQHTRYPHQVD